MESSKAKSIKQGILYLGITFLLTYSCWITLTLFPQLKYGTPIFMILFLIGGFGPTIAAIIILLLNKELKNDYFKRLFKFKVNPLFYLLIILIIMILCALLIIINNKAKYIFLDWYMIFPLFVTMIIGGGLEELGWRGILLELFSKNKLNLLLSTIIIGVIWAFWHLPLFYIHGVYQYQANFFWFFINIIGLALIINIIYTITNSIAMCVILHALLNASYSMGFDVYKNDEYGVIIKNCLPIIVGSVMMFIYFITNKSKNT